MNLLRVIVGALLVAVATAEEEPRPDPEPTGPSTMRRVLPPVAGLAALAVVLSWWVRRRRR